MFTSGNGLGIILPLLILLGCMAAMVANFVYFRLVKMPWRWIKLGTTIAMFLGVIYYILIIWDGGVSLVAIRIWILYLVLTHVVGSGYSLYLLLESRKKIKQ